MVGVHEGSSAYFDGRFDFPLKKHNFALTFMVSTKGTGNESVSVALRQDLAQKYRCISYKSEHEASLWYAPVWSKVKFHNKKQTQKVTLYYIER